jgi:hypothetical protein
MITEYGVNPNFYKYVENHMIRTRSLYNPEEYKTYLSYLYRELSHLVRPGCLPHPDDMETFQRYIYFTLLQDLLNNEAPPQDEPYIKRIICRRPFH